MNYDFLSFEDIPGLNASAAFVVDDSASVFREDEKITPMPLGKSQYIPWGQDNQMPFKIMELFERDETLSACNMFNSEVMYAGGLRYMPVPDTIPSRTAIDEIDSFFLENDMPSFFLGTCKDIKYFEFCVTVLIFSRDGKKITNFVRKEAALCRFSPADRKGRIKYVYYANWRLSSITEKNVEKIPLINPRAAMSSIEELLGKGIRKMAFVTKLPNVDSFYYPIPNYAALFKGKWYNIKQFIGAAKEAKLKNSAPLKYLIEVSSKYFDQIFKAEGILDPKAKKLRVQQAKEEILQFLTRAENSGKALFTEFDMSPDGKELHYVKITKIENQPQGGDWETDHQEAVNMMCFAMRVHSNLVGSVPGKSQGNNSGSDKRELYTIAQAVQRPYHDVIFRLHRIIIKFNGWKDFKPVVPMIQLTTLDEHTDFKEVDSQDE